MLLELKQPENSIQEYILFNNRGYQIAIFSSVVLVKSFTFPQPTPLLTHAKEILKQNNEKGKHLIKITSRRFSDHD